MGYYNLFKKEELEQYRKELFELLLKDAFRKETITLSSGKQSSYYIDARTVTLNPQGAFLAANIILSMLAAKVKVKAVGGPTIGADPLVGAIGVVSFIKKFSIKTFIVRKIAKSHGKCKQIEGPLLASGSEVVIIDDVATTGSSLVEAATVLRQSGLIVNDAIVIVDREEGAEDLLKKNNINLSSIFKAGDFLN
ncbi:MAG: orotate phosphoribosyltransferase [Candidatus Omnitrophota bacterium]